MHRSGTSLVTGVLRAAGLDVGREEFGPGLGQPRSHFEDHDFHDLHEEILAGLGRSCFTAGETTGTAIDPRFEARARQLVADRADRPFWGWKDPRTCLFLDLWDRLLPEAAYLLLYRHPVDVALSLWRRNLDLEVLSDPWLAFRCWELYNRRLLALRERYPDRCFVAHSPALAADIPGFVRRLAERLGLPLRSDDLQDLYDPEELAPSCQPPRPAWEELIPRSLAIFGRLEEVSDLPSAGEPRATGRQRSLVQAGEVLLHALLQAKPERAPTLELEARRQFVLLRLQEEELRKRLEAETPEAQVLREIESSRGFAILRAWWRLRKRLRGDSHVLWR